MKNSILGFVIAVIVSSFASCGGKTQSQVSENKEDSVAVEKSGAGKYCNEKHGFCISFPENIFTTDKETEDGAILVSEDGLAKLDIHRGNLDATITGDINSIQNAYEADIKQKGKRNVTFKSFKSTYYILMGYENKIIFYQKTILTKGQIVTAIYTYDDKAKETYYPMLELIFNPFE